MQRVNCVCSTGIAEAEKQNAALTDANAILKAKLSVKRIID